MRARQLSAAALLLFFAAGCARRGGSQATYTQKTFVLNVQAQFRAYGSADKAAAKSLADRIFAEWNRISDELSYSAPYSLTTAVNNKAYGEWVPVTDEFMRLLVLGLSYYRLTGGAFDITFAPLWPIWKEAASSRRMPAQEDIKKALESIGSSYVQADVPGKRVRFNRQVQVNLGGLLRGYCFERAYRILKEADPPFPVQLRLGGNMLVFGQRNWRYNVAHPKNKLKVMGRFMFTDGTIMSSSGRDMFVEIEGKLYSHILDLRTGYPIEDFSSLTVYYPTMDNDDFLSSAALSVLGRRKAFEVIGRMKGAAALWIDGSGKPHFLINEHSKAAWVEQKEGLGGMFGN